MRRNERWCLRLTKGVAGRIAVAIALSAVRRDDDALSAVPAPNAAATAASTTEPVASTAAPASSTVPPATTEAATRPCRAGDDDGVREVPAEYPTIQAAVDAAAEGDLVLVAPGVYNEAVDVVTDNLTIRGARRDGVVLDGRLELDNGIRVLGASGVVVENLTAATTPPTACSSPARPATGRRSSRPTAPATTASTSARPDQGSDRQLAHGRQPRRRRVRRSVLPV